MPANKEVEAYIRQKAIALGINPEVALKVSRAEALNVFDPSQPDRGGDEGSSFGPFQLHYKGMSKSMPNAGMGDDFTAATGLHASDPSTWRQQVDFALGQAKTGGWAPWMGAEKIGITGKMGIDGSARAMQQPGEQSVTEYRNRPQQPAGAPGEVPPMPQPVYVGGAPVPPAPVDEAGRTQLAQTAAPATPAAPAQSGGGVFDWLKGHLKTGEKGDDARKNLATAMSGMAGKQQTVPQIVQPKAARVDDPTIATIDPQQALMQRQQMAEIMAKLNSGKLWG
jgi:hypothetical protein